MMASFWPSKQLNRVDLPTLGRPIRLAKPARCSGADVERAGGAFIESPEEIDLARVHQARLQGFAVVITDQVQAGVTAQKVQLLAQGVTQRPRLAPRCLDRDDRLSHHGGWSRERECQHVG